MHPARRNATHARPSACERVAPAVVTRKRRRPRSRLAGGLLAAESRVIARRSSRLALIGDAETDLAKSGRRGR